MLTMRTLERNWILALVTGLLLCAASGSGATSVDGSDAAYDEAGVKSVSEVTANFSGLASVDSVRTNLWLCETLLEDVAGCAMEALEPPPGAVRVEAQGEVEGEEILGQIIFEMLDRAGYEVFTDVVDSSRQAAVDYIYMYSVKEIDLSYPRVGRTLGLWPQWVDRDLSVSADIEIVEAGTGRVLFNDLVIRRFSDRVGASDLSEINSKLFSFTSAETSESGWRRRLEEIVVMGTLTGMVAVYFANTGN